MHDTIRRLAKPNETKDRNQLIINGKYFVDPPKDDRSFKELFKYLAARGAGRKVGKDGLHLGPWTPELLAEAISEIDANKTGVDLRTVQLWFQDNDKGIGAANIRWLARVFGCGDLEKTSKWQAELTAAQSRLIASRRQKKAARSKNTRTALAMPGTDKVTTPTVEATGPTTSDPLQANGRPIQPPPLEEQQLPDAAKVSETISDREPRQRFSMARKSEALFNGRSSLNLPVAVWTSGGVLWFLTFIFGVHSVTYSPIVGLDKQVGFYWSLSWTVGEMAILPLFLVLISELLSYWKDERLSSIAVGKGTARKIDNWNIKVESFAFSYWAIFLICFLIIFLLQWYGVYLRPLLQGSTDNPMVDWILVSIERPEVMATSEAIFVSMLAFLFSGLIYWLYFIGLLLMYTLSNDFYGMHIVPELQTDQAYRTRVRATGTKIMIGVFRCSVLGIFLATCIKLNAAYLISDGNAMSSWLIADALTLLGQGENEWSWLEQNPSPFFTSALLTFITCFVFFACFLQLYWVLDRHSGSGSDRNVNETRQVKQVKALWFKMISIVVLLSMNFTLVGQFYGFSILLVVSVLLSVYSLFWRVHELHEGPVQMGQTSTGIGA